jgi:glycosyltransferase involved in cell wall biosynthesis
MDNSPESTPIPTVHKISVVVPCHNYGRYLPEALISLITQSRSPDQIVIVDDGSTDNSSSVIDAFARRYPDTLVLARHPNRGTVSTFNDGVRATSGDFVVILSADDRMSPTYLESLSDALATGYDFAYARMIIFGARHAVMNARPFSRALLPLGNYINGAAMFRRELFDAVGGFRGEFENLGREDWIFWLMAAARGYKGIAVNSCWLEYRRHPEGSRDSLRLSEVHRVHRMARDLGLISKCQYLVGVVYASVPNFLRSLLREHHPPMADSFRAG